MVTDPYSYATRSDASTGAPRSAAAPAELANQTGHNGLEGAPGLCRVGDTRTGEDQMMTSVNWLCTNCDLRKTPPQCGLSQQEVQTLVQGRCRSVAEAPSGVFCRARPGVRLGQGGR